MPIISAILPCNGGIIAPPNIIITKKEEPCDVYLPKPLILNANIEGHIIEQKSPPVNKANKATDPEENNPIKIPIIPKRLNIFIVLIGLSFAIKNPKI